MKILLDKKGEKLNNVAEIYRDSFYQVLNKKNEYIRRLILKELEVESAADQRELNEFSKEVIKLAESQM